MGRDDRENSEKPGIHGSTESQFVELLRDEIRKGISLVPFIGSGLSAPSGILMGKEFADYLTTTIFLCIADENYRPKLTDHEPSAKRDLHRQGWPKFPTDEEVSKAKRWLASSKRKIRDLHKKRAPLTSEENILHEALESLKDWRSTLEFLARLSHINRDDRFSTLESRSARKRSGHLSHANGSDRSSRLVLGEVDQSIIDKFNFHITRGRRPNFGHSMLCHLAGPAHVHTILTTNFDTLIEDAFANLNLRFDAISVGLSEPLPNPDTVQSLNCIIKLHGSIKDTRADHSLNETPSLEDRRRFFSYTRGGDPFRDGSRFRPGHLLVIGYSGKDLRCIRMIESVLDQDPEALVFWVCFKSADQKELPRKIFRRKKYHKKIISVVSSNPDLLLYQLYQEVTLALPGSGFTYQLSPNMPYGTTEEDKYAPGRKLEGDALKIFQKIEDLKLRNPESYVIVDAKSGISNPLRGAFNEATQSLVRTAIWLELEDYFDIEHLAHEILQIIAVRIGRFQLDHEVFVPTSLSILDVDGWRKHCKLLFDTWAFKPASWLIVLYGRNGYGGCIGWSQTYWPEKEERLSKFVAMLAGFGFMVVYAPYTNERFKRDRQKEKAVYEAATKLRGNRKRLECPYFPEEYEAKENAKNEEAAGFPDSGAEYRISKGSFSLDSRAPLFKVEDVDTKRDGYFACQDHPKQKFEDILKGLLKGWIQPSETKEGSSPGETDTYNRQLFLYGCTLFRQSRHYAAFFIDAVMQCPLRFNIKGIDNDRARFTYLRGFLNELYKIGLFHQKPGGFAWMHRDLRLGVRHLLESVEPSPVKSEKSGGFTMIGRFRQIRAFGHYSIADWYTKAFHSTGHPLPLLEALHHYAQCAIFAPEAARLAEFEDYKFSSHQSFAAKCESRIQYRRGLWKVAVHRLIKNLRLSRPVLKLWLEEPVATRWFGFDEGNDAPGQRNAGGEELLDLLEKSVQGLNPRPNEQASVAPKGLAEMFAREANKANECWAELKPLLIHELVTIVAEIRDGPVYSSPQGKATNDPLLYQWLLQWNGGSGGGVKAYRTAFDEEFYQRSDEEWHGHIIAELGSLKLASSDRLSSFFDELVNFVGKLLRNGVFIVDRDLYRESRDFRLKVSAIGDNLKDLPVSFVEIIGRLAHAWVRRATLREHAILGTLSFPASNKKDRDSVRSIWAQACALCRMVIDLCANLHPNHLQAELALREKYSTLYGLALGRLDRFFEAHRRLNEAGAILSNSNLARNDSPLSMRKLRRAEVHILEARLIGQIAAYFARWELKWDAENPKDNDNRNCWVDCRSAFEKNLGTDVQALKLESPETESARKDWLDLYLGSNPPEAHKSKPDKGSSQSATAENPVERLLRQHIAKLDAAWLTLEDAERLLSGKSQSNLWWFRLRELQLRVFAEHQFLDPSWPGNPNGSTDRPYRRLRTLAFRLQRSHTPYTRELFRQGLSIAPGNVYRSLRMLDAFLPAHRNATYADEMLRDPTSDLRDASVFHQRAVKNLLNDSLKACCPSLVESLKAKLAGTDLLHLYCVRVSEAYESDGCSMV
jgi:hypothetical protein